MGGGEEGGGAAPTGVILLTTDDNDNRCRIFAVREEFAARWFCKQIGIII